MTENRARYLLWTVISVAALNCHAYANPPGTTQEKSDPLSIEDAIAKNEVVLIGWAHFFENDVIPNEIAKHLPTLKRHNGSLLLEVRADSSKSDQLMRYFGTSKRQMVQRATDLEIPVIPADTGVEPRTSLAEETKIRDAFMAKNIESALKSGSGKVIFLVGGAHLPGISKALQTHHNVASIRTDADYLTGEVFLTDLNGNKIKQIGSFNPPEYLKTLYRYQNLDLTPKEVDQPPKTLGGSINKLCSWLFLGN